MKILFFLIAAFLFLPVVAAPLEGFSVSRKGFSSELELVTSQLSQAEELTKKEAREVAQAAALVNSDLASTPLPNALFLIKSEIYKAVLESPYLPERTGVVLSSSLVKTVEEKLKKHQMIYGPFAAWIISSSLAELSAYAQSGFIDQYQTISGNDVKARAKALELRKLARYLGPWFLTFLEKTPEEFNRLATDIASSIIKTLARKSYFFKEFSSKYSESGLGGIFDVPAVNGSGEKKEKSGQDSLGTDLSKLRKEKIKESRDALENMEKSSNNNFSTAIDGLMDSSEEKDSSEGEKKGWKPR